MARPARSEEEVERVRQSILDGAERVLARGGLDAASLEVIGAETGFKPASIYTYFASRDALLAHVVERTWARVARCIDPDAPGDLEARLLCVAHDLLAEVATHRGVLELLLGRRVGFGERAQLERLRAHHRTAAASLARMLARDLPAGSDTTRLAYAFLGLVRAEALLLYAEHGATPADLDDHAHAIVRLFLHGALEA